MPAAVLSRAARDTVSHFVNTFTECCAYRSYSALEMKPLRTQITDHREEPGALTARHRFPGVRPVFWSVLCLFSFSLAPSLPAGAKGKVLLRDPRLHQIYHSLRQPLPADSAWSLNDTLTLDYPDLKVRLQRGQLLALHDSTGAITGYSFEGTAHLIFHPRHEIERQQLYRFARDTVVTGFAGRLLLRFASDQPLQAAAPGASDSSSLPALLATLPRVRARWSSESQELLRTLDEALLERRGFNLAAGLLHRRLTSPETPLLVIAFYLERDHELFPPFAFYVHDPAAHEQVAFLHYHPKRLGRPTHVVCSYALTPEEPERERLTLTKYNGWVQLDAGGTLQADMGIDLVAAQRRFPALSFTIFPDLQVERVTAEAGDTLDFVQEKDEAGVTVFLPEHLWPLDTLRLMFHYRGEGLKRHENGTLFLKDPVYWVPRLGYLQRAHYHVIYKYPPRLRVLAVGRLIREWEEAGWRLSFYKTHRPAKAATFCAGQFAADTIALAPPGPVIEVHSTMQRSSRERRRVAGDVANSLHFFSSMLTPYPLPNLRVVEAPTQHSQGFPGFVTLSWLGFASRLEGPIEALRSHEIAHQWFGNILGWNSYHDQWLSEAFAEYLAALYLEWISEEAGHFEQLLAAWRDDLLEHGHIAASIGMQRFGLGKAALRNAEGAKAGPVWMGFRLGQREVLDYYTQTYEKGAYVLHMLRWLLRDLETGSDARFWALLTGFIQTHRDGEPTTAAFQKIAEQHYGAPLDWFFRQWIYRTAVPTYRWRYSWEPVTVASPPAIAGMPIATFDPLAAAQQQILRIQVTQENVPDDFQMPVPVRLEHTDGTRVLKQVWVNSQGGTLELAVPRDRVKRILFNPGNAVLCRMKGESH